VGPQGRPGRARKISPPTGIRSPDHPALSKSQCRLKYPGPQANLIQCKNVKFVNTQYRVSVYWDRDLDTVQFCLQLYPVNCEQDTSYWQNVTFVLLIW